jgi:hypothetical protein
MTRKIVPRLATEAALITAAFFVRNAVVLIGLSLVGLLTFVR